MTKANRQKTTRFFDSTTCLSDEYSYCNLNPGQWRSRDRGADPSSFVIPLSKRTEKRAEWYARGYLLNIMGYPTRHRVRTRLDTPSIRWCPFASGTRLRCNAKTTSMLLSIAITSRWSMDLLSLSRIVVRITDIFYIRKDVGAGKRHDGIVPVRISFEI